MKHFAVFAVFSIASCAMSPQATTIATLETDRPFIERASDLPRFSYDIDIAPSQLLVSDRLLSEFAPRLRADIQSTLDNYIISDPAAERDLLRQLAYIDYLTENYTSAVDAVVRQRTLAEKPSEKATDDLFLEVLSIAERDGQEVSVLLAERLSNLDYDLAGDWAEDIRGQIDFFTENVIIGLAVSEFDEGAAKSRSISNDVLGTLINYRVVIDGYLQNKDALAEPLSAYIASNRTEKLDIWADRAVDISDRTDLKPVIIGVWDAGTDVSRFPGQLWRNSSEVANGQDDDGNGFVDDLHGIAFDLEAQVTPDILMPLTEMKSDLQTVRQSAQGLIDLRSGVQSDAAAELRQTMAEMTPERLKPFFEDLQLYSFHAHGTHVAGIALEGNPAARLMVGRVTFDHRLNPMPFLEEDAKAQAEAMKRLVGYFRDNGARVVNMSWGLTPANIEAILESNGIEADPDVRRARAEAIFDIMYEGFVEAVGSAPQVLFVAAGGNAGSDVEFNRFFPSGVVAPNLVAVGAVDQAGDETAFTSYGPTIVLHANGFEVMSEIPVEGEMAFSGTSMSAPQVTALAGKMFAIDPSLSPPELISILRQTADTTDDGRRFLIHPQRAVAEVDRRKTAGQ